MNEQFAKDMNQFDPEALEINIPVIVAKGMIDIMRLTIKEGLNINQEFNAGMDYLRRTDWYKKLSEADRTKVEDKEFKGLITKVLRETKESEEKLKKIREKLKDDKASRKKVVDDLVQFISVKAVNRKITSTEANHLMKYASRIATDSDVQKAFDRFIDEFGQTEINVLRYTTEQIQRINITSRVNEMLKSGMNESDIINSFDTKWQRGVAFDHIERQREVTGEEVSKQWDKLSLDYERKQKRIKKEMRKESLRFENKKLGWMFYILLILAGVCFIWNFIPMRFLIDEYSQKNLDRIIYHNPKLYISQFLLFFPFLMSLLFGIISSFVKEIDNSLKSKGDNFRDKSEDIIGETFWNFENKELEKLFNALYIITGIFFIWFFLHPYLMNDYSSFYIEQILKENPYGYISLFNKLPIIVSFILFIICSVLKIVDNDLKSISRNQKLK